MQNSMRSVEVRERSFTFHQVVNLHVLAAISEGEGEEKAQQYLALVCSPMNEQLGLIPLSDQVRLCVGTTRTGNRDL